MNQNPSTLEIKSSLHGNHEDGDFEVPALTIAWSAEEPGRVGEVALFEAEGVGKILGRGEVGTGQSGRVVFARRRPGEPSAPRALAGAGISREQLRITARQGRLHVELLGRCPLLFRGAKVDRCTLAPGDTVALKRQLLLLCSRRSIRLPALRDYPPGLLGPFGSPCGLGLIGETEPVWQLRELVAFYAKASSHALVLGPSGAGKELVARAIHQLSSRSKGPFVARSAATLPVGLADAELFGNVKNYPNPGMPERPGLVGAAEGGTLFLDEIGDLPEVLHASLLRVLDGDGEYHRLGEAKARRANVRLVGATNRPPEALKHDLLARLPLRLRVPGLDERRDDIPLLLRHLLRRAQQQSPELVARFTESKGEFDVSSELIEHLLHRPYTNHIRELDGALWSAMASSPSGRITLPEDATREPTHHDPAPLDPPASVTSDPPRAARREPGTEPTPEQIRASIAALGGNLVQAARELDLPSRYALYRLLRKHGIDVEDFRQRR